MNPKGVELIFTHLAFTLRIEDKEMGCNFMDCFYPMLYLSVRLKTSLKHRIVDQASKYTNTCVGIGKIHGSRCAG